MQTFPKRIMKTSELIPMGYSKELLMQVAHIKNSPAFKKVKRAKSKSRNEHWYFYTDKLDDAIERCTRSQ